VTLVRCDNEFVVSMITTLDKNEGIQYFKRTDPVANG
jgi:hypothetical protein